MSGLSVVLFTVMFSCLAVFFGKYYSHFNVSYNVWLWITVISSVAFVALYVFETFMQKKKNDGRE